MHDFTWIAISILTVLSTARITRLLTYDKFPPIMWLREHFIEWTDKTARRRGWQLLAFCGYCMSFWVAIGIVLWGHFTEFQEGWWLVNSIFAASYLSAMVMAYDGDTSNDDPEDADDEMEESI